MIDKLTNAFGVSGCEHEVKKNIENNISKADNITVNTDGLGNLFVRKTIDKMLPTYAIIAHMDEAGIIVTDITKDGYLRFDTVGNIESKNLISSKIKFINGITGVIALKAIHLTPKKERGKPVKISDLYIDIGAGSREQALKLADIGDYGEFLSSAETIGDDGIKGKALSSRAGCKIAIDILNGADYNNINLLCVFTVQKEISSRGMKTAANSLENISGAFVLDGVYYGKNLFDNAHLPPITIGLYPNEAVNSKKLANEIIELSNRENILCEKTILSKSSDLKVLTSKRADIPAVLLGIPSRYTNTSAEMMNCKSIVSARNIIQRYLSEVDYARNF